MEPFFQKYTSELMVLALVAMVLGTLIVIVPQLLRTHHRVQELRHTERLKSLECHLPLPPQDDRARAAGRTAVVVPCVVVIAAATVTCFLVSYRSDNVLAVSIAVWSVAGVVGLAAITGGVALVGRLAQIDAGDAEEERQFMP